jgi:hypothetical protein
MQERQKPGGFEGWEPLAAALQPQDPTSAYGPGIAAEAHPWEGPGPY